MTDELLCTHDPSCPLVPTQIEGHPHLPACLVVTHNGRQLRRTNDEHGNSYITFGDGTGAVHTDEGWLQVSEDDAA